VRADGVGQALLVQEQHEAFRTDSFIESRLGPDEALIEFRNLSLDPGVHSYETVRHFKIGADRATRTDPIALSPRGFVQEWIENDWNAASAWSAPEHAARLEAAHAHFHGEPVYGEYLDATRRCARAGDLWQVGVSFEDVESSKSKGEVYFLVQWRPPYRLRMADARPTPDRACTEPDDVADGDRTLFP